MNPEEAIEILTMLESRSQNYSTMFKKDALKLGIEALEWKLTLRKAKHPHGIKKLPSETPE